MNLGLIYPYMQYNGQAMFCPDFVVPSVAGTVDNRYLRSPDVAAAQLAKNWTNNTHSYSSYTMMPKRQAVPSDPCGTVAIDSQAGVGSFCNGAAKLSRNAPPYSSRTYWLLMCFQDWRFTNSAGDKLGAHEGKGSNVLFVDGKAAWLPYPFRQLQYHYCNAGILTFNQYDR